MGTTKLTLATLLTSFAYFGIMKYMCNQPVDIFTGFIIINFSLLFLAIMIVIILEAAKIELLKDEDTEMLP